MKLQKNGKIKGRVKGWNGIAIYRPRARVEDNQKC